MPSYSAYDYHIHSDVEFPEFRESTGDEDIRIRFAPVEERSQATYDDGAGVWKRYTETEAYLARPGTARMLISDGKRITVDPVPDAERGDVRQFVAGAGLRVVLHQRGHLVLHASAVEIDGAAVTFIGESNAGKSTLAAACYAEGHGVIADDIVVPQRDEGEIRIPPGFPQIKLDRETAEELGIPEGADAGSAHWRYHAATEDFPTTSRQLARIYVVEPADDVGIDPISPGERVYELLRETFTLYDADDADIASEHFEQCTALSKAVPVRKLRRPKTLDELPDLVRLIEDDR